MSQIDNLSRQKTNNLKGVASENNYQDVGERSITNRTPLLEHYQNHSIPRNSLLQGGSTSVPRPTIANGIKMLKEQNASPVVDSSYQ